MNQTQAQENNVLDILMSQRISVAFKRQRLPHGFHQRDSLPDGSGLGIMITCESETITEYDTL